MRNDISASFHWWREITRASKLGCADGVVSAVDVVGRVDAALPIGRAGGVGAVGEVGEAGEVGEVDIKRANLMVSQQL